MIPYLELLRTPLRAQGSSPRPGQSGLGQRGCFPHALSWLTPCQRKSSFPETEEKVRRLKRKNAELAVIAKRLEERARKLQETNLKVVRMGGRRLQGEGCVDRGRGTSGLGLRDGV